MGKYRCDCAFGGSMQCESRWHSPLKYGKGLDINSGCKGYWSPHCFNKSKSVLFNTPGPEVLN